MSTNIYSVKELAASLAGWGILLPLVMGYVSVCGLDPAGIFLTFGLLNIFLGLYYRLPLPLEPMKVLAVMAIAQLWPPSLIYASALAMGIVWLIFAATGWVDRLRKITPNSVVRGICLALGLMMLLQAAKMLSHDWVLGGAAALLLLVSAKSRYIPGTPLVIGLGFLIASRSEAVFSFGLPGLTLPGRHFVEPATLWESLVRGGFAQIPLTLANAVLATATLIKTYWPKREDLTEQKLAWNHGIINALVPFLGGIPMCHGAGSLAGKHYFGARTGGASIIEGLIQVTLGIFLAGALWALFRDFPQAILGAMLLFVSFELAKSARGPMTAPEIIPLLATAIPALLLNMAAGFAAGLLAHHLWQKTAKRKDL